MVHGMTAILNKSKHSSTFTHPFFYERNVHLLIFERLICYRNDAVMSFQKQDYFRILLKLNHLTTWPCE